MKMIKQLPVFSIKNFDDYNHCEHCGNNFYIRQFNKHLKENTFIDKPHGHDFFILLLITAGSGKHNIDFKSYDVSPGTIFFLSPGQVHNWELSEDVDGYILFFTKEYLLIDFNQNKLAAFPFFNSHINAPFMHLEKENLLEMESFFRKINDEYINRNKFFHEIIRLHLKLILLQSERNYAGKKVMPQLVKHQENQVFRFEALIESHYKEHLAITDYADLMNISIKQLNTLCKKAFSKTPGELIQERFILEAKRLLIHSDYSISAIAYMLNYDDYSYFIRLFKKVTNSTPDQFRTINIEASIYS